MSTANTPPGFPLQMFIIEDIEIWANDYQQAIEIYNLTKY